MFVTSLNFLQTFRFTWSENKIFEASENIFAIKVVSPCVRGIKSTREEMMR